MMLIPFVRGVIAFLLVLTLTGFLVGVARIHMAILSFLGGGLLLSISFFETEFNKARSHSGSPATTTTVKSSTKAAKTD